MWPAGVADRRRVHARQLPELPLGAPEAAHAEHRALQSVGKRRLDAMTVDEVAVGHRHALGPAGQRVGGGGIDNGFFGDIWPTFPYRVGVNTAKTAPCGSRMTVKRSLLGTSMGPTSTVAPSVLAFSVPASQLVT